jgi:hypothetical protein
MVLLSVDIAPLFVVATFVAFQYILGTFGLGYDTGVVDIDGRVFLIFVFSTCVRRAWAGTPARGFALLNFRCALGRRRSLSPISLTATAFPFAVLVGLGIFFPEYRSCDVL